MDEQTKKLKNFLYRIQKLESSHNLAAQHKTITDPRSVHEGDTAFGSYGIMPRTFLNIVEKYGKKDPRLQKLDDIYTKGDIPALVNYFKTNPEEEEYLASKLASPLLKRFGPHEELAAAAWLGGPSHIQERLKNSRFSGDLQKRVNDYLNLQKESYMHPDVIDAETPQLEEDYVYDPKDITGNLNRAIKMSEETLEQTQKQFPNLDQILNNIKKIKR